MSDNPHVVWNLVSYHRRAACRCSSPVMTLILSDRYGIVNQWPLEAVDPACLLADHLALSSVCSISGFLSFPQGTTQNALALWLTKGLPSGREVVVVVVGQSMRKMREAKRVWRPTTGRYINPSAHAKDEALSPVGVCVVTSVLSTFLCAGDDCLRMFTAKRAGSGGWGVYQSLNPAPLIITCLKSLPAVLQTLPLWVVLVFWWVGARGGTTISRECLLIMHLQLSDWGLFLFSYCTLIMSLVLLPCWWLWLLTVRQMQ